MDETQSLETQAYGAAKPRRKWRLDTEARELVSTNPNGTVSGYKLDSLPAGSTDYVMQAGLTLLLSRANDPAEAYAKLLAGNFPKPSGPKTPKVNPWRQAIAAVMVGASKNTQSPVTPAGAADRVANLSKEEVKALQTDPAVVRAWHKINGTQPATVSALLAA